MRKENESLPDSSPALTMETKSPENTSGRASKDFDRVSPELTASDMDFSNSIKFLFFDCFCNTDSALEIERPASIMTAIFFAKAICSSALMPRLKEKKLIRDFRDSTSSTERMEPFSARTAT